jgi:nucleotide-binding universal stress UspA family protein
MARILGRRVVAGVDGSSDAMAAVDVAAAEAALRGVALHLVACAQEDPDTLSGNECGPMRVAAVDAERRARRAWPELAVSSSVIRGDPVERLLQASRYADLVVVGRGGRRKDPRAPGSVCLSVAAHGLCPALVVSAAANASGDLPVLLGACASPGEEPVIAFAFDEAALRGVPLRVMHVWAGMPATALSVVDPFAYDLRTAYAEADRLLAETLAGWADKYPEVTVERESRYGVNPGEVLVRASARAGLVVVGPHRPGVSSAMSLGTVARELLTRAGCPVSVIRHGH